MPMDPRLRGDDGLIAAQVSTGTVIPAKAGIHGGPQAVRVAPRGARRRTQFLMYFSNTSL